MNYNSYLFSTRETLLKITFTLLCFFSLKNINGQFYLWTKTTSPYIEILGANNLVNGKWDDFSVKFKTPFNFRYFTSNIFDSIEVVDWGSIYFNNINNGLFDVYGTDLNSRGTDKSQVSYKNEGSSTNHILKIQFHNAGFAADGPNFSDSVNFQLWIYETSNIIEFHYGPSSVKAGSYGGENGPYVQIADPLSIGFNFITLEGNPAGPSVRIQNASMSTTLTGTPANGTVYRFTPSTYRMGINSEVNGKMIISNHTLQIPNNFAVQQIEVLDMNGKLLQSALKPSGINLFKLSHGIYLVRIQTDLGIISQKIAL